MKHLMSIAPVAMTVSLLAALAWPMAAEITPTAKPEDVGLSSERLARIDKMMERRIAAGEISGGVTLVARHGRIAHLEAHGLMDLGSKKPMAKDAVFRIASMTKPVTGVAVMMMLEEGRLRLADPVSKFIPAFKDMKVAVAQPAPGPAPAGAAPAPPHFSTVPAAREITIRDLLTHTSGLVSGPMSSSEEKKIARKSTETLADYIPRLATTPLEFQPGSQWSYSPGAGFDTLGRIVEIVSGQSFDEFLRTRIFDPLGMKEVSFYATETPLASRMPTVYDVTPDGLQKSANGNRMSSRVYFSGAGGLSATAEAYLKFGQMLLNGGELNGTRLLSPRTVELMTSVHVPDTLPGRNVGEGFGLSVRVVNHHVAGNSRLSDGSFGWSGAYGTHFWVDPREEIVAILMIQTPVRDMRPEFENAVMQAVVK